MDKTSRALRRHHRARMFTRALNKVRRWHPDQEWITWYAHRVADNMAICSCEMCKNPRRSGWTPKFERMTMQERKEFERFLYDLKEIEND